AAAASGNSTDATVGTGGNQGSEDSSTGDAESDDRIPPDIPSGNDDDIVARQLREAAMKEDDPKLRDKLWDEYRRYKRGGNG
ncbi:MAG: hypothetical protein AAF657_29990, partial [Acidobacteriota bacterium]